MVARIPVSLDQRLSEHIGKIGISKSEVMTSALPAYLGSVQDVSLREIVFQLEKKWRLSRQLARPELRESKVRKGQLNFTKLVLDKIKQLACYISKKN